MSRPRPTVLFVALAGGLGGSTRSVATVLGQLGSGQVRRVLAAPTEGRFADLVAERRLADERLRLPPNHGRFGRLGRIGAAWVVGRWLWRNRPVTAIHANGPEELNVVAPAAWIFRTRVVVWSHAREVSSWMRRLGWLWRRLLPDVRFAAVSPWARDVLVDGRIAQRDDIAIVPNPIDPVDVVGEPDGHDGIVIGYLGSDARYKGFQLLPSIIEEVADLPVRWLVFADRHLGSDPEPWSRLGGFPSGRVELVGKVSDVRSAYGRCDIVICPSLQESFCRVAAEAMLNGLPVVASDLGPIRDLLGEEDAGLLFPAGDVHAAGKAIRRSVDDPDLRATLGASGRARATSFDPVDVTAQLTALYGLGSRDWMFR